MSSLCIPKYFTEQKVSDVLELDTITCVEYRQQEAQIQKNFLVRHCLFAVVLNGKKIIHTESGDLDIDVGEAFFAQKGSYMFSEILSSEDNYKSLIFLFDEQFLSDFFTTNPHLGHKTTSSGYTSGIFKIKITPLLKAGIESILPYFLHKSSQTNNLLRLKFGEILLLIAESDKNGNFIHFFKNYSSERRKSLKGVVEANYSKPFSIEDFARMSGHSLSTFKKEFKKIFNQPPKKWINRKRLELAHSLLATTDQNVTQVCFEVGFSNLSYFSQLFKKHFFVTPKQIQKNQNQQK